jgi:hypothetical protein
VIVRDGKGAPHPNGYLRLEGLRPIPPEDHRYLFERVHLALLFVHPCGVGFAEKSRQAN